MKYSLITIVFIAAVTSGCTVFVRTNPVPSSAAAHVPADRLLAYQDKKPDYFTMTVTRDEGHLGSACFVALEIEGSLAARIDPQETATFHIPTQKPNMRVMPDPQGRGLCGMGGWTPVDESYVLKGDQNNFFRISLGAYRRPRLLPAAR